MEIEAPRAPKPDYELVHKTRWEKEKIAAGNENAFDNPDDPVCLGNWRLGETVGKGASGRVKIAKHRVTGELAAVKILPKGELGKQRTAVEREIVMMKLMEHPNVLKLYDVWEGRHDLYLIFEYVKGGELFDYIVNHGRLEPVQALCWFKQIISGLAYTHRLGVSHRDLKPENLLIASLKPPSLKIADWGMAAFTPPEAALYTSCGSPHYASPQIVAGEPYDGAASDIWSCGVILFALLTGRLPFDDKNVKVLLNRVKSGKYEMPTYIHEHGQDLIRKMLVVEVEQRITMNEIIKHPFMCIETPLVTFHPPPSLSDIARSIPSEIAFSGEIDSDTMHSLKIIWRGTADDEALRRELLSPECNLAKAFYWLLERYRERRLERYGMDDEVEGGGFWSKLTASNSPAKPYQLSKPNAVKRHSIDAIVSIPLNTELPAVSSMTSTLAAFELIGKEGLEECSNSPKKKDRGLYARPRGPRPQSNPAQANQGLGIMDSKHISSELSQRLQAILGDNNRRVPHRPDEFRDRYTALPESPVSQPRIKRRLTVAYDAADKENIRALVHADRDRERDSPSNYVRPRAVRPRAGTVALTPEETSSSSSQSNGRRMTMIPRTPKQRSLPIDSYQPTHKVSKSLASPIIRPAPPTPKIAPHSPPPSTPSFTAPVTGFFANLFNWRPQSYTLRSVVDLEDTLRICEVLLKKHRVTILGQETDLVWKCVARGFEDAEGGTGMKEVNFRIEFASFLHESISIKSPPSRITGQFLTRVIMIQEKGALSTFKRIYNDLKTDWTLDGVTTSPITHPYVPAGQDESQICLQVLY